MKFHLFAISLLLYAPVNAQYSAQEILVLASKSMSIKKSISYEADCRFKFFDGDDTLRFSGDVRILKEVSDTIFGGYIWYQQDDTTQKLFDTKGLYVIDSKNKKITRFNPHAGEYFPMTGNIRNRMVFQYFLESGKLYNNAQGPATLSLLNDTIISGTDCYKVQMIFPDDEEFSDYKTVVCITKADKVPVLKYTQIKNQGKYEYQSILVKNYRFNTLKKSDFSIGYPRNTYRVDTFVRKEHTPPPLLPNGTKAPEIKGKHYQDSMAEKTIGFAGRLTLLDYWYMACPPCIEAIPVIDKLFEKYKDKGLQVYGINPVDIIRLERLPKFLEYNTINYPIYFADKEIPQSYNISAYPTFYLVDGNGKVIFSVAGFLKDSTEKALSAAIEEALK